MANGDLLTADYQFQLHNTLYGTGNHGVSIEAGKTIEGLGVPDAKTQDVVYNFADGSYANPDYQGIRIITIPCIAKGQSTPAANMTNVKALIQAWGPLTADTDLAFQLTGGVKLYVNGRPRGAKVDLTNMRFGAVRILLRFDCPTPTINWL